MATNERWLLPEGVEELLPAEAWHLEMLRRDLLDLFYSCGYELVAPPLIEYMDGLLTGTGRDLDIKTFKLIDQLTGRLMGLRADMTPQIARIDAHFLKRKGPTRLCYIGPTLYTRPESPGGSREPLQLGAEFFGCSGPEADSEILQLMVDVLTQCGSDRPHIEIGHVGVFRELARDAELSIDHEADLFDVLQRKSKPDLAALSDFLGITDSQRFLFGELMGLSGEAEILDRAEILCAQSGEAVLAALSEIRAVADYTNKAVPNLKLNFDLAELRGYHYHTGIVFSAFLLGSGQAVAKGGRYDDIGKAFGHPRPATGFSADLRQLVKLSNKKLDVTKAIAAPFSGDPDLNDAVVQQRSKGERVVRILDHESDIELSEFCDRKLVNRSGSWIVETIKL